MEFIRDWLKHDKLWYTITLKTDMKNENRKQIYNENRNDIILVIETNR